MSSSMATRTTPAALQRWSAAPRICTPGRLPQARRLRAVAPPAEEGEVVTVAKEAEELDAGTAGVEELLRRNSEWAEKTAKEDPEFFPSLAAGQAPEYLWIGCSDSRVVSTLTTGTLPGDVFTHENVGNIVLHSDMNCMSAVEFSVMNLGVKHIIVCGHYGCGAINAALNLSQSFTGLLVTNNWIGHIRDLRNAYADQLNRMKDEEKAPFLVEVNAIRSAFNVCTSPTIQSAWAAGQEVYVHALIFDLATGRLKRLAGPISSLEQAAKAEAVGVDAAAAKGLQRDLNEVLQFESALG